MTRAAYAEQMNEKGQFGAREGNQGSLHSKEDPSFRTPDKPNMQPHVSPPARDFSKSSRNNREKKPQAAPANEHRILAERNPTEVSVTSTLIANELVVIDAIPVNTKGINND